MQAATRLHEAGIATAHDFNKIIGKYDKIMQFRVIQRTASRFEILIVADDSYFPRIRDDLAKQLRKKLPRPVEFEIILAGQIDLDPTGKIRTLVSNVPVTSL